jgi:hypothetical protein
MKRMAIRMALVLGAVVIVLLVGRQLQRPEDPAYLKTAVGEADALVLRRLTGGQTVEASVRDREALEELAMLLEFDPATTRMRPSGRPATTLLVEIDIRRGGRTVETFTLVGGRALWYGPSQEYQVSLSDRGFGEAVVRRVGGP